MGIQQKGLEKIETVQKSEAVVKYMCRLKVMNPFAFLRSLNQFPLHIYLSQFGLAASKIWYEKCTPGNSCNMGCCSHLSDDIMNQVQNKS